MTNLIRAFYTINVFSVFFLFFFALHTDALAQSTVLITTPDTEGSGQQLIQIIKKKKENKETELELSLVVLPEQDISEYLREKKDAFFLLKYVLLQKIQEAGDDVFSNTKFSGVYISKKILIFIANGDKSINLDKLLSGNNILSLGPKTSINSEHINNIIDAQKEIHQNIIGGDSPKVPDYRFKIYNDPPGEQLKLLLKNDRQAVFRIGTPPFPPFEYNKEKLWIVEIPMAVGRKANRIYYRYYGPTKISTSGYRNKEESISTIGLVEFIGGANGLSRKKKDDMVDLLYNREKELANMTFSENSESFPLLLELEPRLKAIIKSQ